MESEILLKDIKDIINQLKIIIRSLNKYIAKNIQSRNTSINTEYQPNVCEIDNYNPDFCPEDGIYPDSGQISDHLGEISNGVYNYNMNECCSEACNVNEFYDIDENGNINENDIYYYEGN